MELVTDRYPETNEVVIVFDQLRRFYKGYYEPLYRRFISIPEGCFINNVVGWADTKIDNEDEVDFTRTIDSNMNRYVLKASVVMEKENEEW